MPNEAHEITVKLNLKFLEISGKWNPQPSEKIAAWELYIELITRISVVPLNEDEGSIREAMDSLYKLFSIVREILKTHKADVAKPKNKTDQITVAYLCIAILNRHLRPFLSKWHPRLKAHEDTRSLSEQQLAHEWKWQRHDECRKELLAVQNGLTEFASILSKAADFPDVYKQVMDKCD